MYVHPPSTTSYVNTHTHVHRNATQRAKADAKSHTLLWTYAQTVLAHKYTDQDMFDRAVDDFCRANGADSMEGIKVGNWIRSGLLHSC